MANFAPSWTDTGTTLIAPRSLGRGATARGLLDLRAKFGAYLYLGLGRGGTTALSSGVNVEVRRMLNNGGILFPGAPHFAVVSDTVAACLKSINNAGGYAAGTFLFVTAGTGTPAGDDDLCFWGVTSIPAAGTSLPNLEFLRVSNFASPNLYVDSACKVAKINGELFASKANQWSVWCPGGCVYEAVFDYGDDAAGEVVAVVAYAQTYDKLIPVA